MQAFIIKQKALSPALGATLNTNISGNLTGATVALHMKNTAGALVLTASCTILDAAAGTIKYQWVSGNTDTAGTYWLEFWVTLSGGSLMKIPDDGYFNIQIVPDIE